MGESVDAAVGVIVARGIEPIGSRMRVGAELHTERHGSRRIIIARQRSAHTARADERIYILRVVACHATECANGYNCKCGNS